MTSFWEQGLFETFSTATVFGPIIIRGKQRVVLTISGIGRDGILPNNPLTPSRNYEEHRGSLEVLPCSNGAMQGWCDTLRTLKGWTLNHRVGGSACTPGTFVMTGDIADG